MFFRAPMKREIHIAGISPTQRIAAGWWLGSKCAMAGNLGAFRAQPPPGDETLIEPAARRRERTRYMGSQSSANRRLASPHCARGRNRDGNRKLDEGLVAGAHGTP